MPTLSSFPLKKKIFWVEQKEPTDVQQRLRISITDSCNFSCFFCHNEGQGPISTNTGYMSVSEITKIIEIAVESGVKHIKITGGEPLIYQNGGKNIIDLIKSINMLRQGDFKFSLSMITNGYLLSKFAQPLKEAGLDRVTVTLTTLNPLLFNRYIYKGSPSAINKIIDGIAAAIKVNLKPVKVNTVIFYDRKKQSGNVNEIPQIIKQCKKLGVNELRLYTLLWHNDFSDFDNYYYYWDNELFSLDFLDECSNLKNSEKNIKQALLSSLRTFSKDWAYFKYPKRMVINCDDLLIAFEPMKYGRFSLNEDECGDEGLYAIRVSSRGEIRPCLLSTQYIDILQALRSGMSDNDLLVLFRRGTSLLYETL